MPLRDKLQNFNLPDALKAWESSRVGWRIVSYDALRNPPPSLVWFVYLGVLIIACLYLTTTVVVGLHFIKDLFRANSDNLAKSIVMFGSILALPAVLWTAYLGLQQIKISRANQRVDLFMKSTAQLSTAPLSPGSGPSDRRFDVRSGAIFGLQRVASGSMQYHWSVMELLCQYVRESYPAHLSSYGPTGSPDFVDLSKPLSRPSFDLEAAMTVIGRRPDWQVQLEADRNELPKVNASRKKVDNDIIDGADEIFRLRFDDSNLQGLTLLHCNFSRAMFRLCRMERMVFWNCNLSDAWFNDSALTSAIFIDCNLDRARFSNNDLSHCQMTRTTLERTEFFENVSISSGLFVETSLDHIVEKGTLDRRGAIVI